MSAIYTEYFGFGEPPFSLAPDPRYLYASEQHREALAHLLYGVRGEGGFVLLTGEVGTGKTTIFRCLMERLPERTSIAFVLHPRLSVPELLATVCDEFRIAYPAGTESTKTFVDLLYAYLLDITRKISDEPAYLLVEPFALTHPRGAPIDSVEKDRAARDFARYFESALRSAGRQP